MRSLRSRYVILLALSGLLGVVPVPAQEDGRRLRGTAPLPPFAEELLSLRAQWAHQQRAYPYEDIPYGKRIDALRAVERMALQGEAGNPPPWSPIGPTNIGGRTNAIALHPTDPAVIYVGAADGGVWKTPNGGLSWTPLTDYLPSLSMGALALDPLDPQVVYAGTGEMNFIGIDGCKPYRHDQYPGAGVFRSFDGGQTWEPAGAKFSDSIVRMAIDPTATNVLYAASYDGVFKSTDGGDTWANVLAGVTTDVLMDPAAPSVLYAALGEPDGDAANGIYKSTNGGTSWTKQTTGLPGGLSMGRTSLAMALSSPGHNTLYANITITNSPVGIYKTTNGGTSWSALPFSYGDCYKNPIAVDPFNASIVYTGGLDLYKSTNGGLSWFQISWWYQANAPYADHHQIVFSASADSIYDVSDGGVFRSTDGGLNWTNLNNGYAVTQFQSIALHPSLTTIAIGGTQDRGTVKYTGSPFWTEVYPADGGFTAIDPVTPTTMFTEYVYLSLVKSTDSGNTWTDATNGINPNDDVGFYAPYLIDPTNHLRMYAGTDRMYRSTNGAGSWTAISIDLTKNLGFYVSYISAIGVSEANANYIYVGTSDGNLHVSTNGGTGWLLRNAGLPDRYVTRVAVRPGTPETAYAAFSGYGTGHIFRTRDAGLTWTDVSGNLPDIPVNAIVVKAGVWTGWSDTVYVGTDVGCFKSPNGGQAWFPFNNGLPNVVVQDLAYSRSLGVIRAATHGRSVFDVYDTTTAVGRRRVIPVYPQVVRLQPIYPNPSNPAATVAYELPADCQVELKVYDLLGREVRTLAMGLQRAGEHQVPLDGAGLASGVYFCRLRTTDPRGVTRIETRKLIVAK